jgi:hypothetical protein
VVTAVLQMIGRNFSGRELDRVQSRPTPMWKQLSWQPSLCVAGQIRRGIAHPFTIYGKSYPLYGDGEADFDMRIVGRAQ